MKEPSLEGLMADGHSQISAAKIMYNYKKSAQSSSELPAQSPSGDSGDSIGSSPIDEAGPISSGSGNNWMKAMRKLSKAGLVQKSVKAFMSKGQKDVIDPEQVCLSHYPTFILV